MVESGSLRFFSDTERHDVENYTHSLRALFVMAVDGET